MRALAPKQIRSAATVALLRPRVVVCETFGAQLDEHALAAALAHEQAHARHRDPLRIWLAQIVTDLQWPLSGARARFEQWLFALELARDEEAPRDAIVQAVKKRMPSFKLCFDDALQRKGHLEGKVVLDFDIGSTGAVTRASISQDTIKDPEVGCCAALLMRRIHFQ